MNEVSELCENENSRWEDRCEGERNSMTRGSAMTAVFREGIIGLGTRDEGSEEEKNVRCGEDGMSQVVRSHRM